jgi:hypothetical protein
MRQPRLVARTAFALGLAWALAPIAPPALAQDAPAPAAPQAAAPAEAAGRLFLSFIEDAVVVDRQWWEGQLEYTDGDPIDSTVVRGVVALQPWKFVEVGGRVGFGNTDTESGLPDGTGGTDLDLWAKYYLGLDAKDTEYVVGGVVTVPTGDDTAGLGNDAFGAAIFGSLRYTLPELVLAGHVGVRFNEDATLLGLEEREGEVSPMIGVGVIVPAAERIEIVGEADFEGERFDGADDDLRLLGGVNWSVTERGIVRGGLVFGLTDGAPDFQAIVGYAAQF